MKFLMCLLQGIILSLILFVNVPVYADTSSVSDSSIISDIQTKIAATDSLSGIAVTLTSNKGIISVVGDVDTDTRAADLIEVVASIPGVIDVDTSKLNIKEMKQSFADTVITSKVKGALDREKVFGNRSVMEMGVNVETHEGIVYLTGTVETAAQLAAAMALARSVTGVKDVKSQLVINPSK